MSEGELMEVFERRHREVVASFDVGVDLAPRVHCGKCPTIHLSVMESVESQRVT
jgi:hypothetical protein